MSNDGVEYYDLQNGKWEDVSFKINDYIELKLVVIANLIFGVIKNYFCL